MTEQFLSTSRLGNVIQLIALGRQTGVLKAIRGAGVTREQGEIHFVNGQPAFAVLGQMVGNAAFTVLQNWGDSQYIFLEGPLPQQERPSYQTGPLGWPGEQSAPPAGGFGTRPTPRISPTHNQQAPGFPSYTTPLPFNAGPDTAIGGNRNTGNLPYRDSNPFSGPLPGAPMRRGGLPGHFVPQRLTSIDRLENLPLDRRERMVLLLIDGHRSLSDLVRLTRRSEQELQAILSHLAALRLIE
jgi:hypothetical protein